jgi:hypothetical protein
MFSPSQPIGLAVEDKFAALRRLDKSRAWDSLDDQLYCTIGALPWRDGGHQTGDADQPAPGQLGSTFVLMRYFFTSADVGLVGMVSVFTAVDLEATPHGD